MPKSVALRIIIHGRREIRIAIDADRRCVVFDGWGVMKGTTAELLIALAEPYRRGMELGLAPERYPFTKTGCLLGKLGMETAEALRRRVQRCRSRMEHLARSVGDTAPAVDAVIETLQWHGYRLNPDTVRIVAITELIASK